MPQIAGFRGVVAQDVPKAGAPELGKALAAGTLTRDPSRAVYRYHQVFPGSGGRSFVRKTLVCAVRLAPWAERSVRPHEATVPAARDAALAAIRANGAHTAPVLAGFRDGPLEVDRLMRKFESGRPTVELTTKDGTVHQIWRVQDAETLGKLRHYFAPKPLQVLEGHDRYEAMLAYHEELAAKHSIPTYSSANYGLAYLVNLDDPMLTAAPRHRILRGLDARGEAALAAAKSHFIVEKLAGAAKDVAKLQAALADTVAHQPAFVIVFANEADAWKLTLKPDVSPTAEGVPVDRAIQKLDPIAIQHMFLDRVMPKAQVTTETDAQTALAALGGGAGAGGAGGAGGADAVLVTRPVSVAQITHVAEHGQLLPAGSTAFYPPIASGLISLVIDPDEDLV
ncbi:MAG TPA: DUF1015 family protein [Kofleriaceae bacterium]|nr:DUF1015 family protein [Kofleriaceae bacterium]